MIQVAIHHRNGEARACHCILRIDRLFERAHRKYTFFFRPIKCSSLSGMVESREMACLIFDRDVDLNLHR